ncbi:hypothetical protein AGLY_002124 [Aphis glycines]|uniref:Uncharacterized protein n=1 Tax=Aphis glycines TaxID=307491 RepID=A0A6G0U3N2_APHGL|nr:hypothetical protein AGLY_002124 [Aphis glycines]
MKPNPRAMHRGLTGVPCLGSRRGACRTSLRKVKFKKIFFSRAMHRGLTGVPRLGFRRKTGRGGSSSTFSKKHLNSPCVTARRVGGEKKAAPAARPRPRALAPRGRRSPGVLSNRQDEPPRQRAVLTDRSVVTALPSTTPARYLSRLQTISRPHIVCRGITAFTVDAPPAGPRARAAAIPARRGPEGPCFDAFPTCTGSPPPYGRSFSRDGPESPPGCFLQSGYGLRGVQA